MTSSRVSKMLEFIIKDISEWWLENNLLLKTLQLGIKKDRATIECLAYIVSQVKIGFFQNKYTVGIFLDTSATYDNVIIQNLYNKMIETKRNINKPGKLNIINFKK